MPFSYKFLFPTRLNCQDTILLYVGIRIDNYSFIAITVNASRISTQKPDSTLSELSMDLLTLDDYILYRINNIRL